MERHEEFLQKLMVLIALIQGFCLLFLHQAIELEFWPKYDPQWLFALYSIALILPVMLLLGLTSNNGLAISKYAVPFSLLGGALGYYVGTQATPLEYVRFESLLFAYALTMVLASFKALMYVQQLSSGRALSYSDLFRWSWRNFLTLTLSLIFAGAFWLILVLWGELFKAIGIRFFKDLFEEPWFYYPAIALANGFGVIMFRRLTHVIDTITRLQQALMKFLLVVLVFVSVLFLCALPFTGLDPLWDSGGSGLILWMQALMLFFVNAVYQDDPEQRPYIISLHRFIYLGVLLLPIYSGVALYGLSLRVEQYGWSIDRCWAFFIWFFLALFPLGYAWGIIRQRDNWLAQLSRVNVVVGLVFLGGMLLVNSPVLDFRKVSVDSQMRRLANGDIAVEKFDLYYFRRHLAKPGYMGLQEIKTQYGEEHPNLVVRIENLYGSNTPVATSKETYLAAITFLVEDVPPEFLDALYESSGKSSWELQNTHKHYIQRIDLDQDGQPEYLSVKMVNSALRMELYYLEDENWLNRETMYKHISDKSIKEAVIQALKAGEIRAVEPRWNDFELSGERFRVKD